MNPYRIESLHLTQVGPFKELELALPATPENGKAEVHILTGENGTGKTSVLEAIGVMFASYYGRGEDYSFNRVKKFKSEVAIRFASGYSNSTNNLINNSNYIALGYLLGQETEYHSVSSFRPYFTAFAYSGYRRSNGQIVSGVSEILTAPLANATDGCILFCRLLTC